MNQKTAHFEALLPFTSKEGESHSARVRIRGNGRGPIPSLANHPALQSLEASYPGISKKIEANLPAALGDEGRLFTWLRSDPANALTFLGAPLETFQEVCGPEPSVVDSLREIRQSLKP